MQKCSVGQERDCGNVPGTPRRPSGREHGDARAVLCTYVVSMRGEAPLKRAALDWHMSTRHRSGWGPRCRERSFRLEIVGRARDDRFSRSTTEMNGSLLG
jgi:hypothetical protein